MQNIWLFICVVHISEKISINNTNMTLRASFNEDIFSFIQILLPEDEYKMLSIRKGTLSDEEGKILESHVVLTEKLLSQIQFSKELSHVREWASAHHEYLSGDGYPKHISGTEIPMEVRILTILDIFDALTAVDRPYKPGMPIEKALSVLKDMAEKEGKLDKELTDSFIKSRCWEK